MLYENGYGKTINIDLSVFLDMDEIEIKDILISGDYGDSIDNPFFDSFSKTNVHHHKSTEDEIVENILKEIDEGNLDFTEE